MWRGLLRLSFLSGADGRVAFWKLVVLVILASYFVGTPVPLGVAAVAMLTAFGWKGAQLAADVLKARIFTETVTTAASVELAARRVWDEGLEIEETTGLTPSGGTAATAGGR